MTKKERRELQKHRQSISKQYSSKLSELEVENKRLRKQVDDLKCELLDSQDKVRQLEDWNERLFELIDMTEEEFEIFKLKTSRNSVYDSSLNILASSGIMTGLQSLLTHLM